MLQTFSDVNKIIQETGGPFISLYKDKCYLQFLQYLNYRFFPPLCILLFFFNRNSIVRPVLLLFKFSIFQLLSMSMYVCVCMYIFLLNTQNSVIWMTKAEFCPILIDVQVVSSQPCALVNSRILVAIQIVSNQFSTSVNILVQGLFKNLGFEIRQTGVLLLSVGPWTGYLTTLGLSFLIFKMGTITVLN